MVKRLSMGSAPKTSRANCTTAKGASPITAPPRRMRARCATMGSLVCSASCRQRPVKTTIDSSVMPEPMLRE